MVPDSQVFPEQNQLSQEYRLPLGVLGDQETLLAQGVPSCLHRFPLVPLGDQGGQGVQPPPFLHSGQGALDPPEGL